MNEEIKKVTHIDNVRLSDDGKSVVIIDQTQLPNRTEYLTLSTGKDIWDAIYKLQVRGAPAIGVSGQDMESTVWHCRSRQRITNSSLQHSMSRKSI